MMGNNNTLDNYKREEIVQNLIDAGCDEAQIENVMPLIENGIKKKAIDFLNDYRKSILGEIHKGQKQIDCLDYLIFSIRANKY